MISSAPKRQYSYLQDLAVYENFAQKHLQCYRESRSIVLVMTSLQETHGSCSSKILERIPTVKLPSGEASMADKIIDMLLLRFLTFFSRASQYAFKLYEDFDMRATTVDSTKETLSMMSVALTERILQEFVTHCGENGRSLQQTFIHCLNALPSSFIGQCLQTERGKNFVFERMRNSFLALQEMKSFSDAIYTDCHGKLQNAIVAFLLIELDVDFLYDILREDVHDLYSESKCAMGDIERMMVFNHSSSQNTAGDDHIDQQITKLLAK